MSKPTDRGQLDLVRERFTRTAEQFASFSLTTRAEEAALLVRLAGPKGNERALDLACGPGTFTRVLAQHVRHAVALDLTLPLMEQARAAITKAGITNVGFACADAMSLPLASASLDLAVCGYSLHHFGDAARAVGELARVVRPGGRVALMDLLAPDEPERAAANNEIERGRDASHVTTFSGAELRRLVESAGLRVLEAQVAERPRSFDDWMQIAGWHLGDSAYHATRRMMEASIAGDTAGFRPRIVTADSPSPVAAAGDIEFAQISLALVAEKPRA